MGNTFQLGIAMRAFVPPHASTPQCRSALLKPADCSATLFQQQHHTRAPGLTCQPCFPRMLCMARFGEMVAVCIVSTPGSVRECDSAAACI